MVETANDTEGFREIRPKQLERAHGCGYGAVRESDVKDNRIADIRRSLRRLAYQRDAAGNTYCYDEIEVHSAANFGRMLNARIRGM